MVLINCLNIKENSTLQQMFTQKLQIKGESDHQRSIVQWAEKLNDQGSGKHLIVLDHTEQI